MKNTGHKMVLNPLNEKAIELAKSLNVLRGKSFHIRVTSNKRKDLVPLKNLKNYLESHTFMIGEQLLVMGAYDGWSQWYGLGSPFEEFQNWVNEGLVTINIYQTKTSSICPQYIELMKKKGVWKGV